MLLEQSKINTVGLIPSRWGSTRFEGKPLAMINGVPMIKRVYDQASMSKRLDEVYVVTDDDRIENYCNDNNLNVIRIDDDVKTGTDRIALTLDTLDAKVYVNIQGDEPLIDPDAIDKLIETHTLSSVTNAYVELSESGKWHKLYDKNVVKVVTDSSNNALYYSRLSIPYYQKDTTPIKQQLGLYAFDKEFLKLFPTLPVRDLERSESVEMLRFVENGYKVKMVEVNDVGLSVDTPNDIKSVENYLNDIQH